MDGIFNGSNWVESVQFSRSVVSDSLPPRGRQPTTLLCPWDSPGKNTGVAAMPSSRGASQPRDWTQVSHIAGRFFIIWATRNMSLTKLWEIVKNRDDCPWGCKESEMTEWLNKNDKNNRKTCKGKYLVGKLGRDLLRTLLTVGAWLKQRADIMSSSKQLVNLLWGDCCSIHAWLSVLGWYVIMIFQILIL